MAARTHRLGTVFLATALGVAAAVAERARAEIVVDTSQAAASIQVMSGVFDFAFAAPVEEQQIPVTSFAANLQATPPGPHPATARATQAASTQSGPGSFTASSEATVFVRVPGVEDPPLSNLFAQAQVRAAFGFHVTERATVSLSAQALGSEASGDAAVINCARLDGSLAERRGTGVSLALELEPGESCFVAATVIVTRRGNRDFFDPGEREGSLRVSVSASSNPTPEPGDVFTWVGPSSGGFGDPENWDPEGAATEGVPTFLDGVRSDTALVSGGTVRVDVAGGAAALALGPTGVATSCEDPVAAKSGRVVSEGSDLELLGGALAVDATSLAIGERSLDVRDGGSLTLAEGRLCAQSAAIGAQGGLSTASVRGPQGFLQTRGRLSLGLLGTGALVIENGGIVHSEEVRIGDGSADGSARVAGSFSTWETGNLAVGLESAGALTIEAGGTVESENAFVGDEESTGTATVDGQGAVWRVGSLFVGEGGRVEIKGGGRVEALPPAPERFGVFSVGRGTGEASVRVDDAGVLHVPELQIGSPGTGRLVIAEDLFNPLVDVDGTLAVGSSAERGEGSVLVIGDASTDEASLVSSRLLVGVGAGADGALAIDPGGKVLTESEARVGELGGTGDVRVGGPSGSEQETSWNINGSLVLGEPEPTTSIAHLRIQNAAVVVDSSPPAPATVLIQPSGSVFGLGTANVLGVLRAGGVITNHGTIFGPITIDGAYDSASTGQIVQQVAGAPPSPQLLAARSPAGAIESLGGARRRPEPPALAQGPVVFTGDVELAGTLVLQFLNGFAPAAGQTFELVEAGGVVTGAFDDVVVRGLAPGAEFEQTFVDGVLALTSLSDAESLPVVSVKAKTTAREGKPKKGLKLELSRQGDTSQALAVRYLLRGTARNGFDYQELPGVIEIPARKKSAKLALRAFADGVAEGVETFSLELLPGENYTTSLFRQVTVAVEDERPKRKKRR